MNELALFAGAGGGLLASKLLGWRTICAVEIDPYCQRLLMQRQNDGALEPFPIWPDVRTFNGKPWAGIVDVISGGFPCQDISPAGTKLGIKGARSGLWKEMARVVSEVRPKYVFVENSAALVSRGLSTILGDLSQMGFHARWGVFSAGDIGARHKRERVFIVAYTNGVMDQRCKSILQLQPTKDEFTNHKEDACPCLEPWLEVGTRVNRSPDALACWVDRLKATGNGQVPIVAATAWNLLAGVQ